VKEDLFFDTSNEGGATVRVTTYTDCVFVEQTDNTPKGIPPGDFKACVYLYEDQAEALYEELKKWLKK